MKSGKQKKRQLKAARLERQELERVRKRARLTATGTAAVNPALLAPDGSYGVPDFVRRGYYRDEPFRCVDCGVEQLWTATQQKWWYEIAKGGVWTRGRRCRTCRRKERARKAEAQRVHLEGMERKRQGAAT